MLSSPLVAVMTLILGISARHDTNSEKNARRKRLTIETKIIIMMAI